MTNRTRPTLSFSGRASELETLIARWRMACNIESPIPQVVLLKAERGLGKTRLALEFYRWLNENVDGWLTKRYWPDIEQGKKKAAEYARFYLQYFAHSERESELPPLNWQKARSL